MRPRGERGDCENETTIAFFASHDLEAFTRGNVHL